MFINSTHISNVCNSFHYLNPRTKSAVILNADSLKVLRSTSKYISHCRKLERSLYKEMKNCILHCSIVSNGCLNMHITVNSFCHLNHWICFINNFDFVFIPIMFNYDCHILVMYVIVYGPLPTIVVAFVPINIVYCLLSCLLLFNQLLFPNLKLFPKVVNDFNKMHKEKPEPICILHGFRMHIFLVLLDTYVISTFGASTFFSNTVSEICKQC